MRPIPSLCIAAATLSLASTPTQAFINLDDFASGATGYTTVNCGSSTVRRAGAVAGGVRSLTLIVNDGVPPNACATSNRFAQRLAAQVRPTQGALVVSADYKVFHRIQLGYGYALDGSGAPMNLDLTEGGQPDRRIRLRFDGSSRDLNLNVVVFMNDGAARTQCGINLSASNAPFTVDMPLANFVTGLGVPNYADVDYLAVIVQSGSAIGSEAYALTGLSATSNTSGATVVAACS